DALVLLNLQLRKWRRKLRLRLRFRRTGFLSTIDCLSYMVHGLVASGFYLQTFYLIKAAAAFWNKTSSGGRTKMITANATRRTSAKLVATNMILFRLRRTSPCV